MASAADNTDILIVGAGPVGLFLANECARRDLRWRIVEAHSGQSEHSKALAIFPRTLEIFDMAGVVAPFLERANRVTSVSVATHGRRLAHMRFAPVQFHDILYKVSRDILYTPVRAQRARECNRGWHGRRWISENSGCSLWWWLIGGRSRLRRCARSLGSSRPTGYLWLERYRRTGWRGSQSGAGGRIAVRSNGGGTGTARGECASAIRIGARASCRCCWRARGSS